MDATTAQGGERLNAAFAEEEYRGLVMGARVRVTAVAVFGVWATVENGFPEVFFFYPFILGFAVIGVVPLLLRRSGWDAPWQRYVFPLLDVATFTALVMVPNPLEDTVYPAAMRLRYGNELYLFVFLCAQLFTYSPRVVLWTGIAAALAWSVGTLWIYAQPESLGEIPAQVWLSLSQPERLAAILDPHRVYVGRWIRLVLILCVCAAALAAFVWRARLLVRRQAVAERERANLSRYFSANMVDELAQMDKPLGVTRHQHVAVLFADIAGFTRLSEALSPEAVIGLLREFHDRMQRAVFEHGGTLDKYIGDGVMATFGTPRAGTSDATDALRCVRSMVQSVSQWNAERARRGETPVRVGVGAHYGPVVMGDIGGEQRLEFAVVGDTVNVASRLEHLTRELEAAAVVSGDLIEAAGREEAGADAAIAGLALALPQKLRGRDENVRVWLLNRVDDYETPAG